MVIKRQYAALSLVLLCLSLLWGCSSDRVRMAFDGKMSPVDGNRVASEYCQSCHTHRDFAPNEHVIKNSKLYGTQKYKRAKECRTCHYLETNFWDDISHKTRYPAETERWAGGQK